MSAWSDCNAASMPDSYTSSGRSNPLVSESQIREEMSGHPGWLVDNAVQWAQDAQTHGEFTGAAAVVAHYLHDGAK